MKRILLLMGTLVISLVLAACGGDSPEKENPSKKGDEESKSGVSDTSIDDGDYVYEIKAVEQITSQYDDAQVLAVELSFTNNTDEPTSPWMALGLSAEQEAEATVEGLDGATVEGLDGANGLFPDDYKTELVEMGDTDIKPGATVDAVIGFEILYPGEPVKLYNFSFTDEVLFEKVIETTK